MRVFGCYDDCELRSQVCLLDTMLRNLAQTVSELDESIIRTQIEKIKFLRATQDNTLQFTLDGDTWFDVAGSIDIDSELSLDSENPVQNKVITQNIVDINDELSSLIAKLNIVVEIKQDIDSFSYNNDTVTFHKRFLDVNSGTSEDIDEVVQLANSTHAGMMSPSDVNAISQLISDVSVLKGQTSRLLYTTKTNPTAQEIQAFVVSKGYTQDKWPLIGVVVKDTPYIWRYYETDGWVQQVDIAGDFALNKSGLIKGAQQNGKVYAENDGTGSVYGWDNLVNTVNSKSIVSVSTTGTSTNEVGYITINGVESKLAGGAKVTFVNWS